MPSNTTSYTDFNPQPGLNFYSISFKNECNTSGPQVAYIARSNNSGVNVDGVTISGTILTEAGFPISGVMVKLSGDGTDSATTAADGIYNFEVARGNYALSASKHTDISPNEGISSLDILLMRKHILGIAPLPSPIKSLPLLKRMQMATPPSPRRIFSSPARSSSATSLRFQPTACGSS